jgi:hypothetical protein
MGDREDEDGNVQTFVATFRLVGPIKRSTFQREAPDLIAEALNDVLYWSWSIRLQGERLRSDLSLEVSRGGELRRLAARRLFSQTSCDEHLLLVCAANLERALLKVPKRYRRDLYVTKDSRRALWLLRNVYEHWDELKRHLRAGTDDAKGTLAKLRKEFPQADPWSFTINPANNTIVLADVVDLNALTLELRRLEASVLRLERARSRARPKAPAETQ